MKVSVYIPCYNVQHFVKGCIEAVMKQTCRVDEILVIDDGCKDETIAIASKYSEKPADKWRSLNMPQHWGDRVIENPEFLFGSNNVFRKSAVADVGYYNEKCGNNGEDYDISQRLKEK